jgi:hypothetical protein
LSLLRQTFSLVVFCSCVASYANAQEGRFISLPGIGPTTQPTSQPSSQPASTPSTLISQPVEQFRDRPINLLVYRHKKYPDGTDSKSIGLIYWHGIDADSGWRLLAPFFFHYWDTTAKRNLWVFPAGFTYQNKQNKTTLVGPIYQRRDTGGTDTVVFPLYWKSKSHTDNYESLTVGPYYKRQSGSLVRSGVVPFAFSGKDEAAGYRSLGVFPFFYAERAKDKRFIGALLGFYSQESSHSARGLIGPLYLSREEEPNGSPEYTQALFPIWYRKKTGLGSQEQSWFVSLPGFYQHRWKEYTSQGALGEGRTLLFPVGFYHRSDTYQRRAAYFVNSFYSYDSNGYKAGVLPLFYRQRAGLDSLTIAPLFLRSTWTEQRPDQSLVQGKFTLAFPGWRYRSEASQVTQTGLLNSYFTKTPEGWSFHSLPIFFAGKNNRASYTYLLPLLYHKKEPNIGRQTTILGPLYYKRNEGRVFVGAAPLLFMNFDRSRASDSFGDTKITLLPIAQYLHRAGQDQLFVGPLYWNRRYGLNDPDGLSSTYQSNVTNVGVFPLIRYHHETAWEGKEIRHLSLAPIFSAGKNEVKNRSWLYALPVLSINEGDKKLRGVLPLAWFWKSGEEEYQKKLQLVLPLYAKRDTQSIQAFISLLYGSVRTPKGYTSWLGPAFWHDDDEKSMRGLLPLYYDLKTSDGRTTLLFPFSYQYKDAKTTIESIFGVYWHNASRDEGGRETFDRKILFPLFWREQRENSLQMLTGPVLYRRDAAGFDLLAPPIYVRSTTTAKDAVIAPLFYFHQRKDGDSFSQKVALLPLFGYGYGHDWRRLFTPVGFYSQHQDKRRAIFLNTFYWNHPESNGHGLFPFYLWRNDHETDSKTILSLIFARYKRPLTATPNTTGRFLVLGGLFWHGENLDRRLDDSPGFRYSYLLPFYYSYQDEASQTNLKAILPLGFHRETKGSISTSILWLFSKKSELTSEGTVSRSRTMLLPLFWREHFSKEQITNLYAGPLLSHRSPSARWSVLFPLYWHTSEVATGRDFTLIGPYFRQQEKQSKRAGIAPLLYWSSSGEGDQKTTAVTLLPIFNYTHGRELQQLITPVGFYKRTKATTAFALINGFYRDNEKATSLGVLPLYFQRFNKQENSTAKLFFPFYGRYERPVLGVGGPGEPLQKTYPGRITSLLGLYWHGENLDLNLNDNPGVRFTTVFPLYFWKEDVLEKRKALTIGPYFWRKFPLGYESGLFPLLFVGERKETYTVLDLQGVEVEKVEQRKHQYLFPLYFHNKNSNGDSTTYAGLFFWLAKRGQDIKGGLFPVVRFYNVNTERGQETGLSVAPVFRWNSSPGRFQFDSIPVSFYKKEETKGGRILTGFWEKGTQNSRVGVLPLFWFSKTPEKEVTFAGPYFHQKTAENNSQTLLFPLFYSQWTYNGTRQKVLFPFGYYAKEPALKTSSFYALNFYLTKSPEVKKVGLWPLWQSTKYRTGDTESRFSYAFPLYLYRENGQEKSLLTPIAYYQKINDYRRLWVLPYYGTRSGGIERTDYVFPFFYHSKEGQETLSVIGPLYVGYQNPTLGVRIGLPLLVDIETDKTRVQVVTPLYIHTKGKKAERWRVALLWSFARYNKEYFRARGAAEASLTDWELRLPPLFKYTKDNEQSYQWKVLLGLIGFERNINARRLFLFGIPIKLKEKPKK